MAGYLGTKAVLLSTTAADVIGNAEVGGDLTVGGAFTSQGIDDNASATAMTLDASGNVGIGTSSPSAWSSVFTAIDVGGPCYLIGQSAASGDEVHLGSNAYYDGAWKRKNANPANEVVFNNGAISFNYAATGSADAAITWSEAMRIDASGNLLVGTTASNVITAGVDGFKYFASGTLQLNNGSEIVAEIGRYGTDGAVINFYKSAASVGNISLTGSSTAYNTSSDYRLKTDAQPMTGASARVQALNPVNFEWIADGTRVDGFLAHEAQEVVPEAVTGTKDAMRDEEYEVTPAVYEDIVIPAVLDEEGNELEAERTEQQLVTEAVMGTRSVPDYQGIDQSKLVPLLTAALQEALTKIDDMETRLAALEAV